MPSAARSSTSSRPHDYDLSSMLMVVSGGAALSSTVKNRLLELLPDAGVHGRAGRVGDRPAGDADLRRRRRGDDGHVHARPGHVHRRRGPDPPARTGRATELGWLAQEGRVPLGYLGDAVKTARTFPVIDGVRYSVPGDRARYTPEGLLDLQGRDSVTINSGGEKIFAEEVEAALMAHPAVYDVVVAGRPSERWGNEVVAVVQLRAGTARHGRRPAGREREAHRPLQAAQGLRASSTGSCAARRARPTTAGPASRRWPGPTERWPAAVGPVRRRAPPSGAGLVARRQARASSCTGRRRRCPPSPRWAWTWASCWPNADPTPWPGRPTPSGTRTR